MNLEDVVFRSNLTRDGVLFNFPLEQWQGLRACDHIEQTTHGRAIVGPNGDNYGYYARPDVRATYELMADGGYPKDVADSIVFAAELAYCPDTLGVPRVD